MSTSLKRIFVAMAAAAAAGALSAQTPLSFEPALGASPPAAAEILRQGRATGLAQANFDSDGVPDLAISYRLGERGAVAVFRGEYAALYPHFPAGVARRQALGGSRVLPFDPEPLWLADGGAADFVAAGDFDADGRADLVWAAKDQASLAFRPGDGRGGFGPAASRALPAAPTALAAFELDLADGLPEIVAAVEGTTGDGASRQIVRLGGPRGAWPAAAQGWATGQRVTSLASALLDDDGFYDLAFAGPEGWRQIAGIRDGEAKSEVRALADAPERPEPRGQDLAAVLPMRLDDNALADFVMLGRDGKVGFEIHGMLATFTVNTTDDSSDGSCNAAHCSLREAINAANASSGPDTVAFAIPGTPPFRIQPTTYLPILGETITLDGSTQPGFAGSPLIEIHGVSVLGANGAILVHLIAAQSLVRSLAVNGFLTGPTGPYARAFVVDAPDTVVEGCHVGTDISGTSAIPNVDGILFTPASRRGRIGGTAPGAGNLVSGQLAWGILAHGEETRVLGNIVGLDRFGDQPIGNLYGLGVGNRNVVVGGTDPGAGNLISGQLSGGLGSGGTNLLIQGNRIGTDITGELARPNLGGGVGIESGADGLFGGTSAAAANLVSGNHGGISLWNAVAWRVEGNVFGLSASGLPLGNVGVSVILNGSRNRVGSDDPAGGNRIANSDFGIRCLGIGVKRILGNAVYDNHGSNIECGFPAPVLLAASRNPSSTVVQGTFQQLPGEDYRLEFFHSETCGQGGVPQGKYLLGFQNVTTNAAGSAAFTFETPIGVPVGEVVTATATPLPLLPGIGDTQSSTGYSACRTVTAGDPGTFPALVIPQHLPAAAGSPVTVPILFNANGHAIGGTVFSVDLGSCLSFDPVDANADQIPDDIALHLPAGWSATVAYQPGDGDGELDFSFFDLPPFVPLASGTLATVTLGVTCAAGITPIVVPLPFSTAPAASFGNTAGQSVPGTVSHGSIDILPGLRGDCNGDGRVDAGDLTACGLEIFDGDGNFWLDVPGGSFPGIPVGCDSNADTLVDAGDLACKIRIIYGQGCAAPANGMPSSLAPALPGLSVGSAGAAAGAGGPLKVPILFDPGVHSLVAAVFTLELAPGVAFDPADDDADGIPDAIRVFYPGSLKSISYHPAAGGGEIRVVLADVAASPRPLPRGKLLEIAVTPGAVPAAQAISLGADPPPSFGQADGSSAAAALSTLFFDGFESGALGAWSSVVP